jgi:NADPH-dependent 2,4-dienoyl-CoA reductase/sulfur reductase-like enzyme
MSNKRLVIVGGVAGGASAAARARRLCEKCEIIVFERGPHVSFANCGLPYFVGSEIVEQDSLLLQTPATLRARFNLDVRVSTEVLAIDRAAQVVKVRELGTEREYDQPYDALVLSTSVSKWRSNSRIAGWA